MHPKIKKLSEINKIALTLKKKGKTIVLVYGDFDDFHYGHLDYLKNAKKLGDILIVLLRSDKIISARRNQIKRLETLAAVEYIDYLSIIDSEIPLRELDIIKPDIFCLNVDWGKKAKEAKIIAKYGGKIKILAMPAYYVAKELVEYISEADSFNNRAIFLDRDSTINDESLGAPSNKREFKFLEGVIDSLKKIAKKTNYKLIVITNQTGISKGDFNKKQLDRLHAHMIKTLKTKGITISGVYYCPHRAEELCVCRKPSPGMIFKAAKEHSINLEKSWFVGDKAHDLLAGHYAGTKTIKLGEKLRGPIQPTNYADSLSKALEIILKVTKH